MQPSADLKMNIAATLAPPVDVCETSLRNGGKLLFCCNGGSAADSQHLADSLRSQAIALTLDPVMLTACGNDYGFEHVFERPLRGLGRRGDVDGK